MAIGNALIYVIGLPWLAVTLGLTPEEAIRGGLLPFLFWDVVKLVLAAVLFPAAWWVVGRRPGER
jgi:biotin transport system substrate-specific component